MTLNVHENSSVLVWIWYVFGQSQKKIWLKIFGNWEYFSKIFLKKTLNFLQISVFLGESFLQLERKKNIEKKSSDQPTILEGPSACKTRFFFFVALC